MMKRGIFSMHMLYQTDWESVFAAWRVREASNPGWIDCATRIKGWPDWESWRRASANQFRAAERAWSVYQFDDPMQEIPAMLIGPYAGWQENLPQKNALSFDELLTIPSLYQKFSQHTGVLDILKALPFETELIGLIREDTGNIVCIEGHHRATAITLAKKQGNAVDFRDVRLTIALASLPTSELSLLDIMLKKGTLK